jgi:threonine dehydrogenase-like Zn-dependent dehydrogenase
MAEKLFGHSPAALYGYSHMMGGYAGGQAQYARVPFADVGPIKVPDDLPDEKVLFLSDIFATGWQAAEQCNIQAGDVVAVWGCGPVGQFAIRSALMLGADRVIAIDHYPERLELALVDPRVTVLNFDDERIYEKVLELTGGRGPDACIEAVGMEAHGMSFDALFDRVKAAAYAVTDRLHVMRQIIHCCRKGGTVSVAGVYGGFGDKFPMGAVFNKALTIRGGQTHVQRHMQPLMDRIRQGQIDPSSIISHRLGLEDAPEGYAMFKAKRDRCVKVVMYPFNGV